ncbi:hypothetical protein [Acidithiobacillus ferridurans]|uniref:hypothetical protein n=1 Tax=Acidithiobacillus ferridurans TaxID=1232575 RepID=UPI001C06E094|nr:hypothetical protein [Acidithiobacillus ferridurans]MBU2734135.1 hypothetical protein [Acidithiobacillus ferridurans]
MAINNYQGLWQRRMLTTPTVYDDSTLVFWLQVGPWHADLRIPHDRPDFSGCFSPFDCSRYQLQALLRQEGFGGVTWVSGDICEWLHYIDYRPAVQRDLGRMVFSAGNVAIEEYGVETEYMERWERVKDDCDFAGASTCWSTDGLRQMLWLRTGKHFMRVRARPLTEKNERKLWTLLYNEMATDNDLRLLADCESSLGEITEGKARILHSTLPWLEGEFLILPACITNTEA